MERDMDAVRKIVLALKEADSVVREVDGLDQDVFKFNAMLLGEANLVIGKYLDNRQTGSPVPASALLFRLTWEGYNFAESLKDDSIWEKAKSRMLGPTVSWTFDILKEFLAQEMKETLGMNRPT